VREVSFENAVVGETVKKSISVKNEGALSTDFTFEKMLVQDKGMRLLIFGLYLLYF
jgi:hypothetical protein